MPGTAATEDWDCGGGADSLEGEEAVWGSHIKHVHGVQC